MDRPATSKSRGTCRYYTAPRGCFAGDKCKFTHADPQQTAAAAVPILTPYDRAKKCKHYANGFCKRGESCWFQHVADSQKLAEPDEDELCSICFERPVTFGLLAGCSHIFCVKCIRQWRDPAGKAGDMVESGNTKKCPMCRTSSKFITPSSRFWKEGQEGKLKAIATYKESMARVPCKHFQESRTKNPTKPICPFGRDCFYQHLNDDGSKYMFKNGVDSSMRAFRRRTTFSFDTFAGGIGFPFESDVPPSQAGLEDAVLAGNIALGMLGQLTETVRHFDRVEGAGRIEGGVIGVGETRRGTEEPDEATFDQARIQMVASTIATLRAELNRLEQSDDAARNVVNHVFNRRERNGRGSGRGRARAQLRPMVVPGTLAPQAWDLDGMDGMDGAGVRNGLGWNDMFSEVDEDLGDREVDVMERLGVLAGQMLSSLQDLSTGRVDMSRGNTPPPPLEPIGAPYALDGREGGRGEETPSSLELVDFRVQETTSGSGNNDDGDDLPSLQSVSDSSDSENGHDDQVEASPSRSVTMFEHSIDPREEGHQRMSRWPSLRLLSDAIQISEASATPSANQISGETDAAPTASSSNRFSTVVGRQEARMIIDIGDDGDDEREKEVELASEDEVESDLNFELTTSPCAPTHAPLEPPFVTDGRGRVVWSSSATNKDVDHGTEHSVQIASQSPHSATTVLPCPPCRSLAPPPRAGDQLPDVPRVVYNNDFTTDGRGRVINIGSNDEQVLQPIVPSTAPASASSRSFLGRMFDALF